MLWVRSFDTHVDGIARRLTVRLVVRAVSSSTVQGVVAALGGLDLVLHQPPRTDGGHSGGSVTPPCQPRRASVQHGHRDSQRQHEHQLSGGDWQQYVQTHASIMKLRALNVKRIRWPDWSSSARGQCCGAVSSLS